MTACIWCGKDAQVKIEATIKQIRTLLQLAELDEGADELTPEAYRQGQEALQRGLSRLLLERYHWLIDAGRTPPVVAIERGVCSGCHVRLQVASELHRKDEGRPIPFTFRPVRP